MKRKFQFTRPQGARHVETSLAQEEPLVSIHAPARGATDTQDHPGSNQEVSIHAPARGATRMLLPKPPTMWCFNSRARKRRDHNRNVQKQKA